MKWVKDLPAFGDQYEGAKMRELVRILESDVPQRVKTNLVVTKTAAFNVTRDVRTVVGDTSSSSFAVGLPDATDKENFQRRISVLKKVAANVLSLVSANGGIVGPTSFTAQYDGATFESDGSNWIVVR